MRQISSGTSYLHLHMSLYNHVDAKIDRPHDTPRQRADAVRQARGLPPRRRPLRQLLRAHA